MSSVLVSKKLSYRRKRREFEQKAKETKTDQDLGFYRDHSVGHFVSVKFRRYGATEPTRAHTPNVQSRQPWRDLRIAADDVDVPAEPGITETGASD